MLIYYTFKKYNSVYRPPLLPLVDKSIETFAFIFGVQDNSIMGVFSSLKREKCQITMLAS